VESVLDPERPTEPRIEVAGGETASEYRVGLTNHDGVAPFGEFERRREPGDPSADDERRPLTPTTEDRRRRRVAGRNGDDPPTSVGWEQDVEGVSGWRERWTRRARWSARRR
jgi:hypothetical protein